MSYPSRNVSGMDPSRRRRANPPEQRCRCAECDALAEGISLDPEACMRAVADDITAVGWSVSAVLGDEIAPPWAYTIGLWLSHQGPELTMFGLPVEHMTTILNATGDRLAAGSVIEAGDELEEICPCALAIRPVHASWRTTSLFAVSDRYYGYVRPACLQVVWPDRRGRYPGDPGFQARYEGRQPMLWLPREDHPPGVWTRIDQLP
jgi:Domain of unknown function (DUF4262)